MSAGLCTSVEKRNRTDTQRYRASSVPAASTPATAKGRPAVVRTWEPSAAVSGIQIWQRATPGSTHAAQCTQHVGRVATQPSPTTLLVCECAGLLSWLHSTVFQHAFAFANNQCGIGACGREVRSCLRNGGRRPSAAQHWRTCMSAPPLGSMMLLLLPLMSSMTRFRRCCRLSVLCTSPDGRSDPLPCLSSAPASAASAGRSILQKGSCAG